MAPSAITDFAAGLHLSFTIRARGTTILAGTASADSRHPRPERPELLLGADDKRPRVRRVCIDRR